MGLFDYRFIVQWRKLGGVEGKFIILCEPSSAFYLDYVNGHFLELNPWRCNSMQRLRLAVALAGRRGLVLVPIVCLVVTGARIAYGAQISIVTWFRVDEILAGGCLALACGSSRLAKAAPNLPAFTPLLLAPLLLASCHPSMGALNYARPYFAALLIGSTILRSRDVLQQLLCGTNIGLPCSNIVRSLRDTSTNRLGAGWAQVTSLCVIPSGSAASSLASSLRTFQHFIMRNIGSGLGIVLRRGSTINRSRGIRRWYKAIAAVTAASSKHLIGFWSLPRGGLSFCGSSIKQSMELPRNLIVPPFTTW